MKEVVKLIDKYVTEKRIDRHQGLNAVLDFLIDIFDVRHYTTENGWFERVARAEREENHLYQIMLIWMDKVATAMENGSWLDFFGGVYEEMYQSKGKASALGQFYTPPNICDLLAYCSDPCEGKINDSACGSGRTLLAAAAKSGFQRDNFYMGEDIDIVSVKMCALNLMIHGCKGTVVQHDTLMSPICFDYGFRINDIRYPMPTPFYSLTRISFTKEDMQRENEKTKRRHEDNTRIAIHGNDEILVPNGNAKPIFERKEKCAQSYTQLNLFD